MSEADSPIAATHNEPMLVRRAAAPQPMGRYLPVVIAILAPPAPGAPIEQTAIRGNAFHVALADTTGDGHAERLCACYDGTILCLKSNADQELWRATTGAFPFDLAARDIDGDRRAEVLVASSDCHVYAFGPDGAPLWKYRLDWPAYQASPGQIDGRPGLEIAVGSAGRKVTLLDARGKLIGSTELDDATRLVRTGDIDGDGPDEIIVGMPHGRLRAFKGISFERVWDKQLNRIEARDRANMKHWRPYAMAVTDIDSDGRSEILLGSGFYDGNDIRVLEGSGEQRWAVTDGFADERQGFSYAHTKVVAGEILAAPGIEIATLTGPRLRLFDRQGKPLSESQAPMGFTDIAIGDRAIHLASAPNGDDTLYRLDPTSGWEDAFAKLPYQGTMAKIERNLATLRQQILDAPAAHPRGRKPRPILVCPGGGNPNTEKLIASHFATHRAFREAFPYDHLQTAMYWSCHCAETVEGFGKSRPDKLSIAGRVLTPDRVVELARFIETNGVHFIMDVGHSCKPQVPLAVCEQVLEAAPSCLVGFASSENSECGDALEKYLREFWVPLMDLCLKYGQKRAILIEKGAWWATVPMMSRFHDLLLDEKYRPVLHASVEDSNSRSPELNLAARVGLWLGGSIDHFSARIISDEVCWNRCWEWEFPLTGHPFLRQMLAHHALGADCIEIHLDWKDFAARGENPWAFSRIGRESVEMALHLLGKGILLPPTREEVAGTNPTAIRIREPDPRVLRDAFAFHDFRTNEPEPALDTAALGHLGCYWGMSPTPPDNISGYLYDKRYQYGAFVPATPFGFVALLPERAKATPRFPNAIVTDGITLCGPAGQTRPMDRARAIEQFRAASLQLPLRVEGNVFWQSQRISPDHYRLYLCDPGFLDPADRTATLRIRPPATARTIRDLIANAALPHDKDTLELIVPAGAFRILDVHLQPGAS